MDHGSGERAGFTAMADGTAEDWAIIAGQFGAFARGLPDRVLDHLRLLDGDFGGFPVDRLEHSLQTATRAHRDGRDEAYVVMALLHDIGDTLGSYNHPEIAAAMLKPFVSEDKPYVLDAERGLVLALRDPAGGPAFPLDEKLRFVTLTKEERARIDATRWTAAAR